MSETFSKVEVITGVARRRRFPMDQKLAVVAETMQPGMSISYAWLATTAGISGEMIRDMMIECVERRFGGSRAPHKGTGVKQGSRFSASAMSMVL